MDNMKNHAVKAVSELSGVSVRTLHYYDEIGLLKPSKRTETGYRHYSDKELLRLQQILFYRELGFPLRKIGKLLDEPDFNLIDALESHKSALKAQKGRISKLLVTIDNTINHLKKGDKMSNPEMLYDGLPKEMWTTYRAEAMEKYGQETVEHSEKALLKLGKEAYRKLRQEWEQINDELFFLRNEPPESEKVQQLIHRHYEVIRTFWGTSTWKNNQAEAYAGLGRLYVSDERYTAIEGQTQPAYALFMQKAMDHFVHTRLR